MGMSSKRVLAKCRLFCREVTAEKWGPANNSLRTGKNVHDVAILDDIGFPFKPVHAPPLALLHSAGRQKAVVAHDSRPAKPVGEVGVARAGAFDRVGSPRQRPSPAFV